MNDDDVTNKVLERMLKNKRRFGDDWSQVYLDRVQQLVNGLRKRVKRDVNDNRDG